MTVHSVTGVTPNEAMLGREVLTPATLIAQPPHETHKLTVPYVTSFRNTIREAHTRIRQSTASVAKTQKTYFDQHVKGSIFAVDQLVWLYWPRPLIRQRKRKLTQLWSGPWRVKQFHSKLVVVIRHEKTGKHQTVHVDRLAPCHTPTPTATPVHTDTPPPLHALHSLVLHVLNKQQQRTQRKILTHHHSHRKIRTRKHKIRTPSTPLQLMIS